MAATGEPRTTRARHRDAEDLDHDADKIRIGVVTLSLNDLFGAVKYDVDKLPDVQLPRGGRNRLHLNQRVPTAAIDRHDIVRRHVASERSWQ